LPGSADTLPGSADTLPGSADTLARSPIDGVPAFAADAVPKSPPDSAKNVLERRVVAARPLHRESRPVASRYVRLTAAPPEPEPEAAEVIAPQASPVIAREKSSVIAREKSNAPRSEAWVPAMWEQLVAPRLQPALSKAGPASLPMDERPADHDAAGLQRLAARPSRFIADAVPEASVPADIPGSELGTVQSPESAPLQRLTNKPAPRQPLANEPMPLQPLANATALPQKLPHPGPVVQRAPDARAEPTFAPTPTAPAAPYATPGPTTSRVATRAAAPALPPLEMEELYEVMLERLRRELLLERERTGHVTWS
ncbi:MAG TPA: hypothetical protein VGH24_03600, partial [Solirubrobacteraceae bacterium]